MITGGTLYRQHFFANSNNLRWLQSLLFEAAKSFGWTLEAWALLSDHYHLIASTDERTRELSRWIQRFHSLSAETINRIDGCRGRRVWYQYWDTCLTFEASYWARLNYVTNNPVKHGLVDTALDYPFCSASSIELWWPSAQRKKLRSFRYDRIRVRDDFDPLPIAWD
jgi:putative transposase